MAPNTTMTTRWKAWNSPAEYPWTNDHTLYYFILIWLEFIKTEQNTTLSVFRYAESKSMWIFLCYLYHQFTTVKTGKCTCDNIFKRCLKHDDLTHWGRVTHICVDNLTIIGSDNGLSPGRRQAIIWTNAGILLIGPLRTNLSEISM